MAVMVRPLTAELWSALEELFGPSGASNGCWCMYWRMGPAYRNRPRDQNKTALRVLAQGGPAPGLLALDGDGDGDGADGAGAVAVGWCQLGPRVDLKYLDSSRLTRRVDDVPVWSLSCFYIRRSHRGQGVTAALIDAALGAAKQAGAPALEAYPIDTAAPASTSNTFTGTAPAFRRAGFVTVASRPHGRLIMRRYLTSIA